MDKGWSRVGLAGSSVASRWRLGLGLGVRTLVVIALAFAALANVGCGDPCPEELLPGICAGSGHYVPNGSTIWDAVLADIDGDGSSELLSVSGSQLHIAWRDGRRQTRALPGGASALVAGDFDGDGRPELAFDLWDDEEGASIGLFSVELSAQGEIELAELDTIRATQMPPLSLWAGDLDGDGRDEIAMMDREEQTIITVDGRSRELNRTALGVLPVAFDLGDLDGDGVLDLAVADFVQAQILVLRGDGAGGFSGATAYPSALGLDSIAFGDLDDDGSLDIIGRGGTPEVWVHPGDGAGGLGEPSQIELVAAAGGSDGIAVVPPGSDGIGGVMLIEDGALSTYLIDPEGSARGRVRGRPSASALGRLRLRPTAAGVWLLIGESIGEIELEEEPRPVEVWHRRSDNPRLDRWARYAIGDLDLDGVDDLVALRQTRESEDDEWVHRAEIMLADGDGQFSQGESLDAEDSQALLVGDFDGDGAGDVLGLDALTAPWVSFGERSSAGAIALALDDGEVWAAVSALNGPTQTRIVVEIRRFQGEDYEDRIELIGLDGAGALTERKVLPVGGELLGHWLIDLDDDGDDDLIAITASPGGRALRSWLIDDQAVTPGPIHSIAELTGWTDDVPLEGVGVGVLEPAGDLKEPELVIAGEGGLARLRGIDGPAPTVNLETGRFTPELDREPFILPTDRIARLTLGDLNGDDAIDVLRCGARSSAIYAGDEGLAGDAEEVYLPKTIAPLQLDDDDQLDFLVGDEAGFGAMLTATHAGPHVVADWRNFDLERALVGDLDGDGIRELIFATQIGIATFWGIDSEDERMVGRAIDWGEGPPVAALADLDHDGRDELVIGPVDLPGAHNSLAVARWDGGALRLEAVDAPGMRPRDGVLALDVDGDGVDDLIAPDRHGVVIAYGIDPRRFTAAQRIDTPIPPAQGSTLDDPLELLSADLNHDGRPELLRFDSGQLTVLWGRADRAWGESTINADGVVIRGDDLLLRRADTLFILSARGEALGQPRRVIDDPQLAQTDRMISGADLDGDGVDDLLTTHGGDLGVWLSRGAGLRAPYILRRRFAPGTSPVIADIDGRGLAEIIVGTTYGLSLLWGEGDH